MLLEGGGGGFGSRRESQHHRAEGGQDIEPGSRMESYKVSGDHPQKDFQGGKQMAVRMEMRLANEARPSQLAAVNQTCSIATEGCRRLMLAVHKKTPVSPKGTRRSHQGCRGSVRRSSSRVDPIARSQIKLKADQGQGFFRWMATIHRFKARITTPIPTKRMPSHSRAAGRSPRNRTAKRATSKRLSLSTGATFEASPTFKARK